MPSCPNPHPVTVVSPVAHLVSELVAGRVSPHHRRSRRVSAAGQLADVDRPVRPLVQTRGDGVGRRRIGDEPKHMHPVGGRHAIDRVRAGVDHQDRTPRREHAVGVGVGELARARTACDGCSRCSRDHRRLRSRSSHRRCWRRSTGRSASSPWPRRPPARLPEVSTGSNRSRSHRSVLPRIEIPSTPVANEPSGPAIENSPETTRVALLPAMLIRLTPLVNPTQFLPCCGIVKQAVPPWPASATYSFPFRQTRDHEDYQDPTPPSALVAADARLHRRCGRTPKPHTHNQTQGSPTTRIVLARHTPSFPSPASRNRPARDGISEREAARNHKFWEAPRLSRECQVDLRDLTVYCSGHSIWDAQPPAR